MSETSLFETDNERSIVNLVPKAIRTAIEEHLHTNPELFDKDERDLYKWFRKEERIPSPTDNRLRLKFWDEYDRAQAQNLPSMTMINVLSGICSKEYFYGTYLKRPYKVAWLLCPPTGYLNKAEEALEFGLEQLRDILEQNHLTGGYLIDGQMVNQKVDLKLGDLKMKIVAMLDNRVKGAVIQRSVHLNANVGAAQIQKATTEATVDSLRRQIKEMDRQNKVAQNLPMAKPDIEIEKE